VLVELDGHRIEFARPEKWVWYEKRYTIMDLARYYVAVSPWLLPYLEQRPIVYETYPGTINGPNSFEQDPPDAAPRWIKRTRIRGHERVVTYVIVDTPATLVYLVSLFMVTLHVWQSTREDIERPDFLLFDLDPVGGCTLAQLARAAIRVREFLSELGAEGALVKSSGARGLHVCLFIEPQEPYAQVRELTRRLCMNLAERHPEQFTLERDPQKRPAGTVYLDWGQVGRGMTVAAPYSPRACEGAPVSMPMQWNEVERLALSRSKKVPQAYFNRYNIGNVVDLLKQNGDPWEGRRRVSFDGLRLRRVGTMHG
jgi:bifunctional non-homologous end joining protein LigD